MIDYIKHVAPLESSGLEPSRIALVLSSVTNANISVADLENLLSDESLARRNPVTGSWEGALVDRMAEGGALGEGLEELFSHLNKPRSVVIETSSVAWSAKAYSLLRSLVESGDVSEVQVLKVYELAGGRLFGDITEQEVLALKSENDAKVADVPRRSDIVSFFANLQNEKINPAIADGLTTLEQLKASIKAEL
jgi:hypothetical protein